MQKIGLQFQKLAEICTFLENWQIAGSIHKKCYISANFVNWVPIFCMRGQLYDISEPGSDRVNDSNFRKI